MSKLKIRPLNKIKFGGAGTLTSLTTYNDNICGKYSTVWTKSTIFGVFNAQLLQNLVIGFYKETPRPPTPALCIFLSSTVKSMSIEHEVQELLQEFEQRGLQNLMGTPLASPPPEEISPTPTQPMQT